MTKIHIFAKDFLEIIGFSRKFKESRTNLNIPKQFKISVIQKKISIIKTFPEKLFKKS